MTELSLDQADTSAPDAVVSASASMTPLEAIWTRRSNPFMLDDEPTRAEIARLLEAANLAPNHGLTQPWRFFVLRGDARRRVGEAIGEDSVDFYRPDSPAAAEALRTRAVQKLFRAPIIIVVAAVAQPSPRFPFWEEVAATAAAIQNLLIAAHALGFAAYWRSDATHLTELKRLLGLAPDSQVVGLINLGRPDPTNSPPPKQRQLPTELTTWLGWDETSSPDPG